MNDDFEDTQKLIRLKRYEQPPEEYFDGFLKDFQQRQRAELMRNSARSLFFERLGTYFSDFGKQRWLLAGGTAYVAVMLLLAFRPGAPPPGGSAALPADFDAPRGQVTPVSTGTSPLLDPQVDLLNGLVTPVEEGGRSPRPLLQLDRVPRPTGETQIIEL